MRRIIERTVTTVTTTTWKIFWEADAGEADPSTPFRAGPVADPLSSDFSEAEMLSEIEQRVQLGPTIIEEKEVDPPGTEKTSHQSADKPSDDPNNLSV
jgi:hypothetical protein